MVEHNNFFTIFYKSPSPENTVFFGVTTQYFAAFPNRSAIFHKKSRLLNV